jgi:hypothetical protein
MSLVADHRRIRGTKSAKNIKKIEGNDSTVI